MPVLRLTKKNIDAIPIPTDKVQEYYWDPDLGGFGLTVGQTGKKSFVLQKNNKRKKIGRYGAWTPEEARRYVADLIVQMDKGNDPYAERRQKEARGIMVSKALDEYIVRLRSKGGAEGTIRDMQDEFRRHLSDWQDRPLSNIAKKDCRTRHGEITKKSGPYAANLVFRYFRAVYNVALKLYDLPAVNPTIGVDWNKAMRRQEPIPWADLPAWKVRVDSLHDVLRDYLYVVLFTGLRSEDAATIRWEDLDFAAGTLYRPNPKGGSDHAFTIPLSNFVMNILRNRREANAGKDGGWAFSTKSRKGKVEPIVLRRWGRERSQSPHRLRDTYTTACAEVNLSPFDIDTLTAHRPPTGSVTAGYIRQDLEHLRDCQEQVTTCLLRRLL